MTLATFKDLAREAGVPEGHMPVVEDMFWNMDPRARETNEVDRYIVLGMRDRAFAREVAAKFPAWFAKVYQPLRDPVVRETAALRREVAAMKHRLRRS